MRVRRPAGFAQINSSYYTALCRRLQGENLRREMHKTVKKAPICAILWYTDYDMHLKEREGGPCAAGDAARLPARKEDDGYG